MARHLAPTHIPVITEMMDSPGDLSGSRDVDVLVVDYGGLHGAYGDIVYRYSDAVAKWADEHPGKLVVLWTSFTCNMYRTVFEREFGREVHLFQERWDWRGQVRQDT